MTLSKEEIEKARQEIATASRYGIERKPSEISDEEAEFYLMSEDLGAVLMGLQIYLKEE